MTYEKIKEEIKDASLVLVGLGEELTGELSGFYKELAELLKNKDYFIVTLKDREGLEKAGLQKDQTQHQWKNRITRKAGISICIGFLLH